MLTKRLLIIQAITLAAVLAGCDGESSPTEQPTEAPAADETVASAQPVAANCLAPSTRPEFHRCVDGMTRRQLIESLGQPSLVEYDGDLEEWYYGKLRVDVTDENDGLKVGANIYFDRSDIDSKVVDVTFVS